MYTNLGPLNGRQIPVGRIFAGERRGQFLNGWQHGKDIILNNEAID